MNGSIAVPLLLSQVDEGVILRYGLDQRQVETYWSAVMRTLRSVFDVRNSENLVDELRGRVERAGFETQIHFFHASPLQVASDLVDAAAADLDAEQLSTYAEIVRTLNSAVPYHGS